jgi:SAM-dependent methyltransferase
MRKDDVDFYVSLAREANGPVLELGCGTGRVLIPSALAGATITGLDHSDMMLAACEKKVAELPADVRARIVLKSGDMTDFLLGRRYGLITIPFRAFSHLITVEQQLACLASVRRHLATGALLAFDLFQPNLKRIVDPASLEEIEDCPESPLPGGRTVRRTNRLSGVNTAEQTLQVEFAYYIKDANGNTERLPESFPFRYYFRYEVEHLLARAGFEIVALYGDYQRGPFNEGSEMIFVARKMERSDSPDR